VLSGLFSALGLASCGNPQALVPAAPSASSAPLPFDAAVLEAADSVLAGAIIGPGNPSGKPVGFPRAVVIDPLIDGVTGEESIATQTIGARIAARARQKFPEYDIQPFSPEAINRLPFVILGTFTPVNAMNQPVGERDAFRFCLIMADLRSGRVVARKWVRVARGGVDTRPITFFTDSPTWTDDPEIRTYIEFCQGAKVGDAVNPHYVEGLIAAPIINDAIEAYGSGRYVDAINLYSSARSMAAGNQLRVYNGLYLANWKLGRQEPAAAAFSEAVGYGLARNRLGVKILFRPGSVVLDRTPEAHPYEMWLQKIAERAAERRSCLQVVGNTSKSGSAQLNERLSALRAEYIKARLAAVTPVLESRLTAIGVGANNNLVGTGADDATDALDRRVEFKVSVC
jgi:outer membrane protein OmpA-like peptidoglycan-associated protein